MPLDPLSGVDSGNRPDQNYAQIRTIHINVAFTDNNGIDHPANVTWIVAQGSKDRAGVVKWYDDIVIKHECEDLAQLTTRATRDGENIYDAVKRCSYDQLDAEGVIEGTMT